MVTYKIDLWNKSVLVKCHLYPPGHDQNSIYHMIGEKYQWVGERYQWVDGKGPNLGLSFKFFYLYVTLNLWSSVALSSVPRLLEKSTLCIRKHLDIVKHCKYVRYYNFKWSFIPIFLNVLTINDFLETTFSKSNDKRKKENLVLSYFCNMCHLCLYIWRKIIGSNIS